jgi:hypothetical protein
MTGLTESVYCVLFRAEGFLTAAEIRGRVPEPVRKSVDALLSQKFKAGVLVRHGAGSRWAYQLTDEVRAKFERDGVSLKTSDSDKEIKVRRFLGTPERAERLVLAAISGTDGLTADEVAARCVEIPRHQVISSLNELCVIGALRTETLHGVRYYTMPDPTEPEPEPLAKLIKPSSVRQRFDELQAELSAQLLKQTSDHANPAVLHHIAAAIYHLHQLREVID